MALRLPFNFILLGLVLLIHSRIAAGSSTKENAQNFVTKIKSVTSEVQTKFDANPSDTVLPNIQSSLSAVLKSANSLANASIDLDYLRTTALDDDASELKKERNDWAKYQLYEAAYVFDPRSQDFAIIENWVLDWQKSFNKELEGCIADIKSSIDMVESNINVTLSESSSTIDCLWTKEQSYLTAPTTECPQTVDNYLTKSNNIPKTLNQLSKEALALYDPLLEDLDCVKDILSEYDEERSIISQTIEQRKRNANRRG